MITDLKPYAEYKESGLPWVGQVPKHWDLIPNRGLVRRRKLLVGKHHGDYRLLSLTKQGVIVRDISTGKGKFSSDMGTSQEVRSGDLIFCLFDVPETPRTVGLSRYDGMITGAYTVFESLGKCSSEYFELFYKAMDDRKLLSPLYSGLRHTIPAERLLGTKTPQPTLREQAAIVRFLDWATGRLERAISAKRKVIALLTEQKQAIIHRAVTRGFDISVSLKPSGIPWLGDIPQHWALVPNRSFLSLRREVVGKKSKGYTLLSLSLRGVISRDMENPTGKWPSSFDSYQAVEPDDLIFCLFDIDETPRFVGLSKLNGMVTGAYTVLRCRKPAMAKWAYTFYLAMDFDKRLRPAYTGLRKVIQKSTFLGLKLPMPTDDERAVILAEIANQTEGIDTTIGRLEREIELLTEYRTRLIADVVTGKLDVRKVAAQLPEEVMPELAEDDAELSIDTEADEEARA